MDGWKYVSANGRKESGFENLKTRFQDCNLSRKHECKLLGQNESNPPFNRENKQSAKKAIQLFGKIERKEAGKKEICLCKKIEVSPSFGLSTWNERKPPVNLYGWNEIKMYHKKELLQ